LPEIGVSPLGRSKPSVLKLLIPPQRRQSINIGAQDIFASTRCGCKVEQRAVGVKDASLYAVQASSLAL
jgi:hypothetical protein